MAKSRLALANISVSFGAKPLLTDISISLECGQITALIGRSGSGKTLCALALQGLLPPNLTISGEVLLDDSPYKPSLRKRRAKSPIVISILQNPRTYFNPLYTIKSHIAESLRAWGKPYDLKQISSLLHRLGLDSSVLHRYAFEMSGGELQRVMILIALLADAQFLIADEPTSDLDAIATKELLEILRRAAKELGKGVLLITHDHRLMRIADVSYHIDSGKITARDLGSFHTNFAYISLYDRQKSLESTPLITLHNITKSYQAAHQSICALDSISLTICAGERLGIVGRSGSGKSTLARLIARLELESSGQITYPTHWHSNKRSLQARRHFYRHIQLLFQDPISALNPNQTLWDTLTQGLIALYGVVDRNEQRSRIMPILQALGLESLPLDSYPAMLSGGQAARINLASVLVLEPELLILDESTSCLDANTEAMILEHIATMQAHRDSRPSAKQNLSVLCITHNLSLARAFCDRIVLLDSGEIVEIVAANEPFKSAQGRLLESTFACANQV